MIYAVPIELKQANDFVDSLHRHHNSVHRDMCCDIKDEKGGAE